MHGKCLVRKMVTPGDRRSGSTGVRTTELPEGLADQID